MNVLQMLCEADNPVTSSNMKPTVAWMSAKFDELNARFFRGELPKPKMVVTELGYKTLGSFCFSRNITINAKTRMPIIMGMSTMSFDLTEFGPVIKMNSEMSRSESHLANTLCHEMVHWYCDWSGCMNGWGFPKRSHGKEFQNRAEIINARSNGEFHISTYTNLGAENAVLDDRLISQSERRKQAARNAPCNVIWLKYRDGKEGFILTYPASTEKIENEIVDANRLLHHVEWLRVLEDPVEGNVIKNDNNLRLSRTYNGYYDVEKFPLAKEAIHKNSNRFSECMMSESCRTNPRRRSVSPITENDGNDLVVQAGAPIHED